MPERAEGGPIAVRHEGVLCEDAHDMTPPWADGPMPDSNTYVESEVFCAGALSTIPPFDHYHPAWALPHARQVLHALSEWEPTDG